MVRHSILCEYTIGTSAWDSLAKNDYIAIAEWIAANCEPLLKKYVSCTITVGFNNGGESEYSIEEFSRCFSSKTPYRQIGIGLYAVDLCLTCTIYCRDTNRHIYAAGSSLTLPQLEDLADNLKQYVEQLYKGHEPQEIAVAPVSEIQNYGQNEPNETHSTESQSDTGKKFYKSPVFWAAAIVIVTVLLWAIDRFILGK